MSRRATGAAPPSHARMRVVAGCAAALAAAVALPAAASAASGPTLPDVTSAVDTTWVIVAGVLVMFMQAGFAFLEIGFSRMKNAGAGVAKILMNFSIASIAYWACGFALAFGGAGAIAGTHGFFLNVGHDAASAAKDIPFLGTYDISPAALLFFQFVFCAVSLAIVWGTTLERIKWQAYVVYAIVFAAVIYPVISHWIFGGGWLSKNAGMQDFAGSTVVHLIGATGAVAGLIVVFGVLAIDKVLDDPVGALSAHGLAGIWGTLSCGIFTSPRLADLNAIGKPGLVYTGSFHQLGAQALGVATAFTVVFVVSYGVFWAIKKTIGLRVTDEEEDAGLDIAEHGMYGYPEQFIPAPEIGAGATGPVVHRLRPAPVPSPVSPMTAGGEVTA